LLILLMIGSLLLVFNYNFQKAQATDSLVVQWTKTYLPYNQSTYYVVQTKDGGYAIAGIGSSRQSVYSTFSTWGVIINTDSAGNLIWNKTYTIGTPFSDTVSSFVQTNDGGYAIIINGLDVASLSSRGMLSSLIKTDVAGNELWNKSFAGYPTMMTTLCSVLQASDGGLVWGGNYRSLTGQFNIFLNKTDLLNHQIWSKTYPNQ
jgi:hypothetical protein